MVIIIVGVVVLIVGVAGGAFVGLRMLRPPDTPTETLVPDPGPMIELGEFTSKLADQQTHIVRLKITVEVADLKIYERLNGPGWLTMMKDEINRTLLDQKYDSLRFAEGMEKLKQDIKARLNAILPRDGGIASINKVLFDEYLTQ
jgi:flagellar basal body-associated protein FliL